MSDSMGTDQTKQLSSLTRIHTICKNSPQIPFSYILITNRPNNCWAWSGSKLFVIFHLNFLILTSHSMGPDQTKHLSNLGQGPTYLQKFPPTPCQLRPMSNSMGPGQTKQLSSLIWVQTICKSSPQLPVSYMLMSNSMGPYLLFFVCLIWFFTSTQQSFSYAGRSSWVEPVLS